MITRDDQDRAALHALGLLGAAEAEAFEQRLRREPELAAFVASLDDTAAKLAHLAPAAVPSVELRQRVLTAVVAENSQAALAAELRRRRASRARWREWIPAAGWAAAATLMLACVGLAWDAAFSRRRYEEVNATVQLLQATAAADHVRAIALRGDLAASNAQVQVAWLPARQQGLLVASNLPVVDETRDYQVWIVDGATGATVSAGTFRVDEQGAARVTLQLPEPVQQVAGFRISLERRGGAAMREGPVLIASR